MSQLPEPLDPFHLPIASRRPLLCTVVGALRSAAEWAVGFPGMNRVYRASVTRRGSAPFCDRVLEQMGVRVKVSDGDLERIPREGAVILIANHPFGGLDGLALLSLLLRRRPDARLIANFLLGCMPEMAESCFLVDPFGGPSAARRNLAGTRAAIEWLRQGGALGMFPAGEVSSVRLRERSVSDPEWSTMPARLAQQAGAPLVPVYFSGRNSTAFQIAGLLHPRLRTALLPREFLGRSGRPVEARIGAAISAARLKGMKELSGRAADARLTTYLRARVYLLAERGNGSEPTRPVAAAPLHAPIEPRRLADEIAGLVPEARLLGSGAYEVYCAEASAIPCVLTEIGRLRERTFRPVGEGVGRPLDLDAYDAYYRHLFVWHVEKQALVGAYRVGATDEILARRGVCGLYTHSLFRYDELLIERIGPALEMGRSFVVAEYQREYQPLLLLWRGIGALAVRSPRYRRLFGAVSISDRYRSATKELLIAFLRANCFDAGLAALTHPRRPPVMRRGRCETDFLARCCGSLEQVDELIRELESDGKSAPVLLRQYLRLNARILAFNVDPDFGDALDGLVVIDLTRVQRPILDRYLGRGGAAAFLAAHGATAAGEMAISATD